MSRHISCLIDLWEWAYISLSALNFLTFTSAYNSIKAISGLFYLNKTGLLLFITAWYFVTFKLYTSINGLIFATFRMIFDFIIMLWKQKSILKTLIINIFGFIVAFLHLNQSSDFVCDELFAPITFACLIVNLLAKWRLNVLPSSF